MAAVQVAVATASNHFAASDDGSQEIYFTCTPHKMCSQIEISPSSWAETLPLFSIIEVRKRSKWDSSTRAVREQVAVSGPRPPLRVARQTPWARVIITTLCVWTLHAPLAPFKSFGVDLWNSCFTFILVLWAVGWFHDKLGYTRTLSGSS